MWWKGQKDNCNLHSHSPLQYRKSLPKLIYMVSFEQRVLLYCKYFNCLPISSIMIKNIKDISNSILFNSSYSYKLLISGKRQWFLGMRNRCNRQPVSGLLLYLNPKIMFSYPWDPLWHRSRSKWMELCSWCFEYQWFPPCCIFGILMGKCLLFPSWSGLPLTELYSSSCWAGLESFYTED